MRPRALLQFAMQLAVLAAVQTASGPGMPERLPTFDVASVKPSNPNKPHIPFRMDHGFLSIANTVLGLIGFAFDFNLQDVRGGPAWMETDIYDVQAKADSSATSSQVKLMLQALLAERFLLKHHIELATASGYTLTIDRTYGQTPPASHDADAAQKQPPFMITAHGLRARGVTMDFFCQSLSNLVLRQPVVNATGLPGRFDINLDYDTTSLSTLPQNDEMAANTPQDIFYVLRQHGMKLMAVKVQIKLLQVDQLRRPTQN